MTQKTNCLYILCQCPVLNVDLMNVFVLISEFLIETGKNPEFEKYTKTELCQELRALYAGLRTKKGHYYSKSAYINIRSGLNRYLNRTA